MRSSELLFFALSIAAAAKGQLANNAFVTPQQLAAGAGDTKMKVQGYGFTSSMQVLWNGQPRATQFVNDFLLKVTITRSDLAAPTLGQLSVVDTSTGQAIAPAIPILVYLPLANNGATNDAMRGKIYVSVSVQDPNGPSLAIVDTVQGIVERYIPLPSDPRTLALTADANYLYVGMTDRIRRIDLTGGTPNADVPASVINALVPSLSPSNTFAPTSLLALPNQDTSFIVAVDTGFVGGSAFVVDGTTVRPGYSNDAGTCLVGTPDGVTIYGGPGLRETTLSATGLPFGPYYENDSLDTGPTCPVYANGLIYGSDGDVVNPVSQTRVQWIAASGNVDVVTENGEIHFLDQQGGSGTSVSLQFKAFGMQSGSLLKNIPLGIQMSVANGGSSNGYLIHWGTNGVAFGDYSTLNSNVATRLYMFQVP